MVKMNNDDTWLKPKFVIHSSLKDMSSKYKSAKEAFSAGNYELAAQMAFQEEDERTHTLSKIMFGSVTTGLERLKNLDLEDAEALIIRAFALWSFDKSETALSELNALGNNLGEWNVVVQSLTRLITTSYLNILVIHSSDSLAAAPLKPGPGFTVTSVTEEEIVSDFNPTKIIEFDLILCMGFFPTELRNFLDQFKGPLIAVVSDFDMNAPQHWPILSVCDCLLVSSSFEHHKLRQMYGKKRIAAFPGRHKIRPKINQPVIKDYSHDLTFSGRAFSLYWPDRARFLFRIATIDDPALRIRIVDGFLPSDEHERLIFDSRYSLIPMRFGFSLLLGRTADTLFQGSSILSYGPVHPQDYAPELAKAVELVDENNLEYQIREILTASEQQRFDVPSILNDIFSEQPSYDRRILKYILFQLLLSGKKRKEVEKNQSNPHDTEFLQAFQNLRIDPLNSALRDKTLSLFRKEYRNQPNRIMPAFNYARLLWLLDQKEAATEVFMALDEFVHEGELNPQADYPMSHLVNGFAELMPYQEYYQSVVLDIATGTHSNSRLVITSVVKTYLGLNRAQLGDLVGSLDLFRDALNLCPGNSSAARLLAKVKFGCNKPAGEVWKAIEEAVLIYPPYLTELLPFGLATLEKLGQTKHAQSLARQWAYFITRVEWTNPTKHPVLDQTWNAVTPYFASFPITLKQSFESRNRN